MARNEIKVQVNNLNRGNEHPYYCYLPPLSRFLCLVSRPRYSARLVRFASRGPGGYITEMYWPRRTGTGALHGLFKGFLTDSKRKEVELHRRLFIFFSEHLMQCLHNSVLTWLCTRESAALKFQEHLKSKRKRAVFLMRKGQVILSVSAYVI